MKVIFMGTPEFSCATLQKLIDAPNYQNWKFLSYRLNILKNGKQI